MRPAPAPAANRSAARGWRARPGRGPARYEFLTAWLLESPREPVWMAICDQARWPQWWRGVESVALAPAAGRAGAGSGVAPGVTSRMVWRSFLPYRVAFEVTTTKIEAPFLLEGEARGALEGVGRWRLFERDGVTAVLYEWNVATTKPWMNLVAPYAGALFERNHDWVMARGAEGMARLLDCRLLAQG